MIEENVYKFTLRIVSILLLTLSGAIAISIWVLWLKLDRNLIRARIFLNEGFLRKTWFYMFTGTTFFAFNQILVAFFGYNSELGILAEVFKVIFIALVLFLLIDYHKLVKSCVRE